MIDPIMVSHRTQEIRDLLGLLGREATEIDEMFHVRQFGNNDIETHFGTFKYTNNKNEAGEYDGTIDTDNAWFQENIKALDIYGHILWCNKKIIPMTAGAIAECFTAGYKDYIDFSNGGGCYCNRHKSYDINKDLSFHAYGLAIDHNPKRWPLGSDKTLPAGYVKIWKKWGFFCGERWRMKDNHHFQIGRLPF